MKIHTTGFSLPRAGAIRNLLFAIAFATLLISTQVSADENSNYRSNSAKRIVGNWYLALDAGAFDPGLSGTFLSGLAQFHSDKTFMLSDAGDFGADSFLRTLASPQYGSWRYAWDANLRKRIISGTTIILEAHKTSGEMLGWNKVHFKLQVITANRVEGTINAFFLPCAEAPPFPTPLTCPDPVEHAADFAPASPPDVPVTLSRIKVGQ